MTPGGIAPTTMDPLATTDPRPIVTPFIIFTFEPINTSSPITTGLAFPGSDLLLSEILNP